MALYFGIGFGWAQRVWNSNGSVCLLVLVAALLQFLNLAYNPIPQIPTAAHRQETGALLQRLKQYSGDIHWSSSPWYLAMLGKPTQGHDMSFLDTVLAKGTEAPTKQLKQEYMNAIKQERYLAIVMDIQEHSPILRFVPDVEKHYQLVDSHLTTEQAQSLTYWIRKPTYLFVRKSDMTDE